MRHKLCSLFRRGFAPETTGKEIFIRNFTLSTSTSYISIGHYKFIEFEISRRPLRSILKLRNTYDVLHLIGGNRIGKLRRGKF